MGYDVTKAVKKAAGGVKKTVSKAVSDTKKAVTKVVAPAQKAVVKAAPGGVKSIGSKVNAAVKKHQTTAKKIGATAESAANKAGNVVSKIGKAGVKAHVDAANVVSGASTIESLKNGGGILGGIPGMGGGGGVGGGSGSGGGVGGGVGGGNEVMNAIDKYQPKLGDLETRMAGAKGVGQTDAYGKAMGAVDANAAEANQAGPSKWAQTRMSLANEQEQNASNKMAEDSTRGLASSQNNMMAQGGMGSGAMERMQNNAARNNMFAGQGLAAQTSQAKLGISADDAAQKAQMRAGLAGQYGALDQADVNRQQGNSGLEMQKAGMWGKMASDNYGDTMAGIGGNASANAALAGNKKGGILDDLPSFKI